MVRDLEAGGGTEAEDGAEDAVEAAEKESGPGEEEEMMSRVSTQSRSAARRSTKTKGAGG